MKKIITLSLTALLCVAAAAQTDNKLSREHMNKLAARAEMQKQQRMRQAPKLDASKFMHDGSATLQMTAPKGAKAAGDTVWASQMPEQRWFPGEWEEVQAIVVTWPYTVYPAGHVGDEDYAAEMNVPGYGAQYQYNSSNPYNPWTYIGWGPVVGVPDTTDYADQIAYYRQLLNYPQYASQAQEYIDYLQGQWDFRNVFVNLIDAIQHGTKVWITVQQLSDSTLIKDVMAAEGKPLTDYRLLVSRLRPHLLLLRPAGQRGDAELRVQRPRLRRPAARLHQQPDRHTQLHHEHRVGRRQLHGGRRGQPLHERRHL